MKIKNYFNNLEKYWSANFLALLSSVFLLSFIVGMLINLVDLSSQVMSFSEYIELVDRKFPLYSPIYSIIFFPVSCFLSVRIFIFYLFIIISKKKWCIIVSILPILFFLSKFFVENRGAMEGTGFGDMVFFYLLPMSVVAFLISIGIYLILLLLELIPKFRVPQSLVSQTGIFKKYIRVFYWLYFIIICHIICILIYLITYSSTPRY